MELFAIILISIVIIGTIVYSGYELTHIWKELSIYESKWYIRSA